MKKLLILLLVFLLSGCTLRSQELTGQVIDRWQENLILMPEGGGRVQLQLPAHLEEPQTGSWVHVSCRGDRILSYTVLEDSQIPLPTEFHPDIPSLTP